MVVAALFAISVAILRFRVFVTHDSISNYGHVWFISQHLRHSHWLPYHMPVLGHGKALAYPYGFVPWTLTAIARYPLGDWSVTLSFVVAFWFMVVTMFRAFPELRDRALAICALANPAMVIALIAAQLPFMVSMGFLFIAIRAWRGRRPAWAAVACGVAQLNHVAVVAPIAAVLVFVRWRKGDRRRELLWVYGSACVIAAPAAWLVLTSPVFTDASIGMKVFQFTTTVAERAPVLVIPVLAAIWHVGPRLRVIFAMIAIALNLLVGPLDTGFPWQNIFGDAPKIGSLDPLFNSPEFTVGSVYRVLGAQDGKVPMYNVLKHGGVLDSELFPESIHRESFDDAAYVKFVSERMVDFVALSADYDHQYRTNEHALLDRLAADPSACRAVGLGVRRIANGPYWFIYRLDRSCHS